MYHVPVHTLAQRVRAHIRREELLHAGDRVGVAVSGGIDSVALLRLLLELRSDLGIVLSAVHLNHKLRGAESDTDEEFVANLACQHGLEFYCESGIVARYAAEKHISLEAAARELRYGFFRRVLGAEGCGARSAGAEAHANCDVSDRSAESAAPPKGGPQPLKPHPPSDPNGTAEAVPFYESRSLKPARANKIATGHTLDDQAETVLMRLIRGTGLRGLGGIHPRIVVETDEHTSAEIIRPLLGVRRCELELYLREINQPWREDSTNADDHFTRNRVRKLILPLLEKEFNPAVAENLSELAEIARGEEDYWENEAAGWFGTTVQWSEDDSKSSGSSLIQIGPADLSRPEFPGGPSPLNASINRAWFLTEPIAVQRRVIRAIADSARVPLEFKHIEEILHFAAEDGPSGKALSLPLGWKIVREPESLVFLNPDLRHQDRIPRDYEYELPVPGRIAVPEAGSVIEALRITQESDTSGYNPQHLLDAESVRGRLRVRNWRPGDRFWPAHTKSPKKIKELLQQARVAQPERPLWPVVLSGDEVVWVRGFPAPAKLRAHPGRDAVVLREMPLAVDSTV